ncbi:MAG: hypothetical protein KIT56_08285, partial [Gammaproteobacteria bacterium]|nr:hypothetical protein [Gammaproteobacteria bacterium]
MLETFYLSIKLSWREWRAGEWTIAFFALLLAVIAATSVHFYTDRLTRGLDKQGAKFLGGDIVISSSIPIPLVWKQKARQWQLSTAEVWSYPSMASRKNKLQLINVQAVSDEYQLLNDTHIIPDKGTIWVESRLLPLLSINLGDTIAIGAGNFSVNKILTSDIDSLNTAWVIAPRAMIRLTDVPATHTVLPGSRVDYRLLIIGEKQNVQKFREWITPQLSPSQALLDVKNPKFSLQNVIYRTENYMNLVLLFCLMMSGVAIVLSIQQYLRRHYSHVALWRCLGAKRKHIITIFLIQLFGIAFSASILGTFIGYLAQEIFVYLFRNYIQFPLPSAGLFPVVTGFVISNLLLFAFSYPVISAL